MATAHDTSGLRIGVTVRSPDAGALPGSGEGARTAAFLVAALKGCPQVAAAQLVDLSNRTTTSVSASPAWPAPISPFADAKDALDLLIEVDGQLDAEQTDYLKSRGTRLVSYVAAPAYVNVMQSVLFSRRTFGSELFVNPRYDAIWIRADVAELSEGYVSTLWRRPAETVPFLWEPAFLDAAGEYRPRTGPRKLLVAEPNADVARYCFYPILIAEETYRAAPSEVAFLHVTNADDLATNSAPFISLMTQLDIVRDHKAAFVRPFPTAQALAELADVVIAHQWMQPVNAFVLEACWQGYPVVHNAELCPDLGYYYAENDVDAGAAQALRAIREHDADWEAFTARQRQGMDRFRPGHATVVDSQARLLQRLMAQPLV